jgi:hypothetical protein
VHVVCSPRAEVLAIIAAYLPDLANGPGLPSEDRLMECVHCGQPSFDAREVDEVPRALDALDRANQLELGRLGADPPVQP